MSADRFGVPDTMLGPHVEEFYGALGRIVALSALLENRILDIYQALMHSGQDEHTELGLSALIHCSRQKVGRLESARDREALDAYLNEAANIVKKRNDYVHNLWPAQPDGRLFGWRPQRSKEAEEPYILTETTFDEVQADLTSLVELLQRWHQVYTLVSARRHASEDKK